MEDCETTDRAESHFGWALQKLKAGFRAYRDASNAQEMAKEEEWHERSIRPAL